MKTTDDLVQLHDMLNAYIDGSIPMPQDAPPTMAGGMVAMRDFLCWILEHNHTGAHRTGVMLDRLRAHMEACGIGLERDPGLPKPENN